MTYIPDPTEIIEMQAERLIDEHWDEKSATWKCCCCGKEIKEYELYTVDAHPCSPPTCWNCLPKWAQDFFNGE